MRQAAVQFGLREGIATALPLGDVPDAVTFAAATCERFPSLGAAKRKSPGARATLQTRTSSIQPWNHSQVRRFMRPRPTDHSAFPFVDPRTVCAVLRIQIAGVAQPVASAVPRVNVKPQVLPVAHGRQVIPLVCLHVQFGDGPVRVMLDVLKVNLKAVVWVYFEGHDGALAAVAAQERLRSNFEDLCLDRCLNGPLRELHLLNVDRRGMADARSRIEVASRRALDGRHGVVQAAAIGGTALQE